MYSARNHTSRHCSPAFHPRVISDVSGTNTEACEQLNSYLRNNSLADHIKYCSPATYIQLLADWMSRFNRRKTADVDVNHDHIGLDFVVGHNIDDDLDESDSDENAELAIESSRSSVDV